MTTNVNAPHSTFNNVGGNLIQNNNFYQHEVSASTSSMSSPLSPFNDAPVDLLSTYFTGRERELELISGALERPRASTPHRCVLFGDQGVGKSQLTYEWAKSTFERGQNAYVFWMSGMSVEKLDQGFTKILVLARHSDRSHPDQTVRLTAARRWLEEVEGGDWLVVVDNVVTGTVRFLREHLPRKSGGCVRGSILLTTRTRSVALALAGAAEKRHEVVEVPMLDVEQGVKLFVGQWGEGTPLAKVEAMVKGVGCLPLAISHAMAYMEQTGSSVDDMLVLYQSGHKIDLVSWENHLSDYEHKSVAATFDSQLEDLDRQCPDASHFLRVLAFLDSERIPLDMIVTGVKAISDPQAEGSALAPSLVRAAILSVTQSPIRLRNAIAQLESRSLVTYQGSSTLRMHDLIQLVVLENTRKCGGGQEWFECAVSIVCYAFEEIENHWLPGCWSLCEALVPHIQSLTARQEISSRGKAQLLVGNHHFARYLHSRGRYGEAEELYQRVLTDREQLFGVDDLDMVTVMHGLAAVYESQNRFNDAETVFEQVLRRTEERFGPNHIETLYTLYRLALIYDEQGRYGDAEVLLCRILAFQEKELGMEDPDTLSTMYGLGRVYDAQKRYDLAEALFQRVLTAQETQLGADHVHTLTTKYRLGCVYGSQGRYDEAEVMLGEVLVGQEGQLGREHVSTRATMYALARVYESQGQCEDAQGVLRCVMESESKEDPGGAETFGTMYELALAYGSRRHGRLDGSHRPP